MSTTDPGQGQEQEQETKELLDAVSEYVSDRHSALTRDNVLGFSEEDLDRLKVDSNGYLEFTVETELKEKEVEDNITLYYVAGTLFFQVTEGQEIEGSTDIYQCYRCFDAFEEKQVWCIEWHSS